LRSLSLYLSLSLSHEASEIIRREQNNNKIKDFPKTRLTRGRTKIEEGDNRSGQILLFLCPSGSGGEKDSNACRNFVQEKLLHHAVATKSSCCVSIVHVGRSLSHDESDTHGHPAVARADHQFLLPYIYTPRPRPGTHHAHRQTSLLLLALAIALPLHTARSSTNQQLARGHEQKLKQARLGEARRR
jgi:hypothetical protein